MSNAIQEIFDYYLPNLDKGYSNSGIPLMQRPFEAASFIVKHIVVEVKGYNKNDYINAPWFAAFYHCAHRWYENRYGDLSSIDFANKIGGAIAVFERWFFVSIPNTLADNIQPDETFWVYFPTDLHINEQPLNWLPFGPNVEKMSASTKERVVQRIGKVAALTRRINLSLQLPFTKQWQIDTADHIKSHITSAARQLSENTNHNAQLAIWEIYFAIEKSLKLWLHQRECEFPSTHNLVDLHKLVLDANGSEILDEEMLKRLPSDTEAIQYRHGQLPAPSFDRQKIIYELGLECVRNITDSMQRDLLFYDAGFQLKLPPWKKYES